MKLHRILCLGAAIVIPQLALAKLPLSNDAFGRIEGTLDFCAQTDPQAAPKYQERKRSLVRDVPEKEVAEARKTQEYKDAYQWVSAELAKVPKDKAAETCAASVEGDK
jgi:hypothetical protein